MEKIEEKEFIEKFIKLIIKHKSLERKRQKTELQQDLLLMILKGLSIPAGILAPGSIYGFYNLIKFLEKELKSKSNKIVRSLVALKRKNLIEADRIKKREILKITDEGKIFLIKNNLELLRIERGRKWDGKWRIVSFDIPHSKKSARDTFRKFLKQFNFCPLQKSFFVSPYPCYEEIQFLGSLFGVAEYIVYGEATFKKEEEKFLKEWFGFK